MKRPSAPSPPRVPLALTASLLAILASGLPPAGARSPSGTEPASGYVAPPAVKINVMGEWAHPDDDTSIIGPCGVWHDLYDIKCGIIMVTRGEGGGNAVGPEKGPALGLRRENEDRAAHYRSGTVDVFNIDAVDFFYNQSAPLTQLMWNHEESLRRITRIIRTTQPDIYIGFTPSLASGHGNHQQAGRFIWEGVLAAADPEMFPEQLTGPGALSTWQVKKVFSGGSSAGNGGTVASAHCTTGFTPSGLETVSGVWTGYDSPYLWPVGNTHGGVPGTPKTWAEVASEGGAAYPTQSRSMWVAQSPPGCPRYGMSQSFVPFQRNGATVGGVEYAGRDDAILYGATLPDPGGLPLGTLEYLTFSSFFNVAGDPFDVTLHVRSGSGTLAGGSATLTVPAGWSVDAATEPIGPVSDETESTVTFSVTPAAGAGPGLNKIAAMLTSGQATGYTDGVMQIVPPVEGRFHRWGKWEEYDRWLSETAPQARRVGRSAAVVSMGLGETIRFSVDVHNWSDAPQTGSVTLTVPTGFAADATSKPYGTLAPDADVSVPFTLTNTVTSLASSNTVNGQTYSVGIATSFSAPASSSSESLAVSLVPTTTIPGVATAPALDGAEGAGEYPGPALGLGTSWQGIPGCVPAGISCGSAGAAGTPTSTYAKVARHGDDLYLFIHVRDDYQSYAVKPDECFAHWLTDSVEILLDPRGNSSQTNFDTGTTFKLAVFPFSNDPQNVNGQGANGPCWSRDADNHQGFSVGPLADTVPDAPNAPGVKVVSTAEWVGTNEITTPHGYGPEGSYDLEVKIPMSVLPAAVGPTDPAPTASAATNVADPLHLGLNITPYDADLSAAPGTTTLQRGNLVSSLVSTRLGWSAYGSVQSDPWRWGHAYLDGYTPPEGRPIDPPNPIVAPGLKGVDSPQSIYQSAHDGVPIAGRPPADAVETVTASLEPGSVEIDVRAIEAARAHIFLWNGDHGAIPVWATSCTPENDPPPDYGFTACGPTDGGVPPWSPDMSGRLLGDLIAPVETGTNHFSIPIDSAAHDRMAAAGSVLISFEDATGANQAFDLNLTTGPADRTGTS